MVSLFGRGFDSRQLHRQSPHDSIQKRRAGFSFSHETNHINNLCPTSSENAWIYTFGESYEQGYSMSHPSWVANAHYEILPFDIGNKRTRRT